MSSTTDLKIQGKESRPISLQIKLYMALSESTKIAMQLLEANRGKPVIWSRFVDMQFSSLAMMLYGESNGNDKD